MRRQKGGEKKTGEEKRGEERRQKTGEENEKSYNLL